MFLLKIPRGDCISFSSQFYSTSIRSSSEGKTSPVKGRAIKAHMKDMEKQEKAKIVQEVADNKMAKGKDTIKEKKDKASKGKGAKDWKDDEVTELLGETPSLWDAFVKDYSNYDITDIAYKEIADIFGCNITSIQGKFNGLWSPIRT